jgi:glycosyltransferase involved in cell wall biosynthesis
MKISIIIPVFNEVGYLSYCINSLSNQTEKDYEVVLVDDGSTDGTLNILREIAQTDKKFILITSNHMGAGAARNIGAKSASGKILVFLDADMTFEKNFLKKLTQPIISGKFKGTFSRDEIVSNWENVWARCWNIEEGWEKRKRHPKKYPSHQPVFRAVLRSEFEKVGGFTPGGYDDDWSLSRKLGYEAQIVNHAVFYHKNPSTLQEVFNHAKWVGKRKYKFGLLGTFYALLRTSFPVSILIGTVKSIFKKEVGYILFKIVFDFGRFVGIISYLFTKKGYK